MLRYIIEKLVRKLGRNEVENAMPAEHKKLIRYITKQEKLNKKKREEKRAFDRLRAEELLEEKEKKKRDRENERDGDDEEDYEPAQLRGEQTHQFVGDMETENAENNNLLLKFDTMQEKFHFVEHPFARIKEKKQKEAEILKKADNDVVFNEQTGKIYVTEDITGKKRKGDVRFGEDLLNEDEPGQPREQRVIRKVVRVAQGKFYFGKSCFHPL